MSDAIWSWLPTVHLNPVGLFLLQLAIILVVAKLFGEAAHRLGQSSVLGELLAGTVIGPFALGWIQLDHTLELLMELGVIFLLFETGMETNLRQLLRVGLKSVAVATTGVVLPFATGYGVGALMGYPALVSIMLGATLTATSIGITARTLHDLGETDSAEGRIIIGAAVLDDVVGLVILAVMQALLASGSFNVGGLAVQIAIFLGFALILGRYLAQPLMNLLDRFHSSGAMVPLVLGFIFLVCLASELGGLSVVIGAFVAGVILNHTRQHSTVHHLLQPVAAFLAPLFFVGIGAQLDIGLINPLTPTNHQHLLMALGLTVVAIAGKWLAGWAAWGKGLRRHFIGIGMVPRGEVGLIFAQVGRSAGVLDETLFSVLVLTVFMTTFVTPPALTLLNRLRNRPVPDAGLPQTVVTSR